MDAVASASARPRRGMTCLVETSMEALFQERQLALERHFAAPLGRRSRPSTYMRGIKIRNFDRDGVLPSI